MNFAKVDTNGFPVEPTGRYCPRCYALTPRSQQAAAALEQMQMRRVDSIFPGEYVFIPDLINKDSFSFRRILKVERFEGDSNTRFHFSDHARQYPSNMEVRSIRNNSELMEQRDAILLEFFPPSR